MLYGCLYLIVFDLSACIYIYLVYTESCRFLRQAEAAAVLVEELGLQFVADVLSIDTLNSLFGIAYKLPRGSRTISSYYHHLLAAIQAPDVRSRIPAGIRSSLILLSIHAL